MRHLPFGARNQNNGNMADADFRVAVIFKPGGGTGPITIYAIACPFKVTDTQSTGGGDGYWGGNTGIISSELRNMSGTLPTGSVLATPAPINARTAHDNSGTAFGLSNSITSPTHQFTAIKMPNFSTTGITLDRQTTYAFVAWNSTGAPGTDFFSYNFGTTESFSGLRQNTNDITNDGSQPSIQCFDETERVMWFNGSTWVTGINAGQAGGAGNAGVHNYDGSGIPGTAGDRVRIPSYALFETPFPASGTAYPLPTIMRWSYSDSGLENGASGASWKWLNAPRATTITKLSAYSGSGNPGVLTVKVYARGGSTVLRQGSTNSLTGTNVLVEGAITTGTGSVTVNAGEDVEYSASGSVVQANCGSFVRPTLQTGNPNGPLDGRFGTSGSAFWRGVGAPGVMHAWFALADVTSGVSGQFIAPSGIAAPSSPIGTAVVKGKNTISAAGAIASAAAVGSHAVSATRKVLVPGIATTSALGVPTAITQRIILPPGIVSAGALGVPKIGNDFQGLYDAGRRGFLDGSIDWDTDTIKASLVTDDYSPHRHNDEVVADMPVGCVAGTSNLTGRTAVNGVADANDPTFTLSQSGFFFGPGVFFGPNTYFHGAGNVIGMVIYKESGAPSTSRLIAYLNLSHAPNVSAGTVTVAFSNGPTKIFAL